MISRTLQISGSFLMLVASIVEKPISFSSVYRQKVLENGSLWPFFLFALGILLISIGYLYDRSVSGFSTVAAAIAAFYFAWTVRSYLGMSTTETYISATNLAENVYPLAFLMLVSAGTLAYYEHEYIPSAGFFLTIIYPPLGALVLLAGYVYELVKKLRRRILSASYLTRFFFLGST